MTQHEIGRMWQSNRVSTEIEAYSTGATEAIMHEHASSRAATTGARRFLGACVEGERHDMAIRMVCDVLRSRGWETRFLGADTPDFVLLRDVAEFRPAAVGLSATWLLNVERVRRTIALIREGFPDVKIVIGGAPFDQIAGLADKMGADAPGGSLLEMSALLDRLVPCGA